MEFIVYALCFPRLIKVEERKVFELALRKVFVISLCVSLFLWTVALLVGWATVFMGKGMKMPEETYKPWSHIGSIFFSNFAAMLSIFSGILTLGFTSFVNVIVLVIFASTVIKGAYNQFGGL